MDISWQVLRRIVQAWAGAAAEPVEVKPLDGGCINTTVKVTLGDGQRAVLKISSHRVDRSYEIEAYQLRMLAALGLPAPGVYATRVGSLDEPHSYLLMEFIEGIDLIQARSICTDAQFDQIQCDLAEMLLKLHSHTAPLYGRVLPDDRSTKFDCWASFYRDIFDPIWLDLCDRPVIPVKSRKQIGKIHDRLDRLLQHDDQPRLVHWDVWSTNILARPDGDGQWHVAALLDPSCKYAHVEAEMAYLALFHTATPACMKTYQRRQRFGDDYHRLRKPIYQMYFLLNHVHLFGAEYLKPLLATVEKLSAVV